MKTVLQEVMEEIEKEHNNGVEVSQKKLWKMLLKAKEKEIDQIAKKNTEWIKVLNIDEIPKDTIVDVIFNKEPYQGYIYKARSEWFCILENRYKSTSFEECIKAEYITHYQHIIIPNIPIN